MTKQAMRPKDAGKALALSAEQRLAAAEQLDRYSIPEPNSGCVLWFGNTSHGGYGSFSLLRRTQRAHRVAFALHNGDIPSGMCVMHKCDTPACVNPLHLSLGTNRDNVDDKVSKERVWRGRGIDNPRCKLSLQQVAMVRHLAAAGHRTCDIARAVGCTTRTVWGIRTGLSWSTVPTDHLEVVELIERAAVAALREEEGR